MVDSSSEAVGPGRDNPGGGGHNLKLIRQGFIFENEEEGGDVGGRGCVTKDSARVRGDWAKWPGLELLYVSNDDGRPDGLSNQCEQELESNS